MRQMGEHVYKEVSAESRRMGQALMKGFETFDGNHANHIYRFGFNGIGRLIDSGDYLRKCGSLVTPYIQFTMTYDPRSRCFLPVYSKSQLDDVNLFEFPDELGVETRAEIRNGFLRNARPASLFYRFGQGIFTDFQQDMLSVLGQFGYMPDYVEINPFDESESQLGIGDAPSGTMKVVLQRRRGEAFDPALGAFLDNLMQTLGRDAIVGEGKAPPLS